MWKQIMDLEQILSVWRPSVKSSPKKVFVGVLVATIVVGGGVLLLASIPGWHTDHNSSLQVPFPAFTPFSQEWMKEFVSEEATGCGRGLNAYRWRRVGFGSNIDS